MIQLTNHGMYLVNGVPCDRAPTAQAEARQGTMAWRILQSHNISGDPEHLRIRFDAMVSHDITYVMPPTIKLRVKARQPAASFSISKLKLLEWESKWPDS